MIKFDQVIMNADDLGMSEEIDQAILLAAQDNFIHSASLSVVNGASPERVKNFLNLEAGLSLGLHINLTEGRPLTGVPNVAALVKEEDKRSFKSAIDFLSKESSLNERIFLEEMRLQLKKFVQLTGLRPNHLDSHQHFTYLSPIVFRSFLRMAHMEDIPIRSPLPFIDKSRLQQFVDSVKMRYNIDLPFLVGQRSEELSCIFKDSKVQTRTFDCMTQVPTEDVLRNKLFWAKTIEVVCHPHHMAYYNARGPH